MQWYSPEFNAFCLKLESKLTSLRKAVLFVLWQAKQPLKPYEILSCLHDIDQKSHATAVYRVLDYLCQIGVAHKLDSMQAYTLCHAPRALKSIEVLMICQSCRRVMEEYSEAVAEAILAVCKPKRFAPDLTSFEIKGFCEACRVLGK